MRSCPLAMWGGQFFQHWEWEQCLRNLLPFLVKNRSLSARNDWNSLKVTRKDNGIFWLSLLSAGHMFDLLIYLQLAAFILSHEESNNLPQPFSSLNNHTQPPQNSLQKPRPPKEADPEKWVYRGEVRREACLGNKSVQKSLSTERRQSLSHSQKLQTDSLCRKKFLAYPNEIIADYN